MISAQAPLFMFPAILRFFDRLKCCLPKSVADRQSSSPELSAEALEPRILYSAAPVEVPAQTPAPAEETPASPAASAEPAAAVAAPTPVADAPAAVEAPAPVEDGQGDLPADVAVDLVDVDAPTATLNQEVVETLAAEARQRWIDSGISADQLAALDSVSYNIADVGGAHLGVASGFSITIDDDAGGSGVGNWFIDSTPGEDEEFGGSVSDAASGRYDLLSTLIHEQGHVLGLSDVFVDRSDVMDGFLGAGTRRLPEAGQADGAVAGSLIGENFLTAHTTSVEIDGGNNLVIEDIDGADTNDNLFIGIVDGRLQISDTRNTVGTTIIGATEVGTLGRGVSIDLASFTGNIVVRTLGGDDVVTFGDLSGLPGGVMVEDSDGHDVVKQTGEITLTSSASLQYTVEEIRLERGSAIHVADGTIALLGNTGETSAKRSVGVFANGSTLTTTGTGNVTITGFGGIVGSGNRGVDLRDLDISLGGGTLAINGTGGAGTSSNEGVRIGRGSEMTVTGSANLNIIGNGRGSGSGNRGITIQSDVDLVTGGGALNVFGTGADGKSSNAGVYVQKASLFTAGSNLLQIFGTGKGSGSNNTGVILRGTTLQASSSGQVTVLGLSSNTSIGSGNRGLDVNAATIRAAGGGNVSFSGSGGGGSSSNSGVRMVKTTITSDLGSVNVTANTSAGAVKNSNRGVNFSSGSITAGTTLSINATTAAGASSNEAVRLVSVDLMAAGSVTVSGSATLSATGSSNRGTFLQNVQASGSEITVSGNGGNGINNNEGLRVTSSSFTATSGAVDLEGIASNTTTGSGNRGTYANRLTIQSNTDVDINGFRGSGTNNNSSLYLNASMLTADNGSVELRGGDFGDTTGKGNYGALIRNTAVSAASSVSITGSGGEGTDRNNGLTISGGSFDAIGTTLSIIGTAKSATSGKDNYGTKISNVTFAGIGTSGITGTGGGGTNGNYGVQARGVTLTSQGSGASIQGSTSGNTIGSANYGARLITVSVSGGNAFVSGTGSTGTSGNYGLQYRTGMVTGTIGNIGISGTADSATSRSSNSGSTLKNVVVQAEAGISLTGTGGGGTSRNHGLQVDGGSLTNNVGIVSVAGNGDLSTTGSANFGLKLSRTPITTNENLNLVGNAGTGTSGNFGVYLNGVTAAGGDETFVSGLARTANTGSNNYGIYLNRSDVSGTNLLSVDGTGGGGKSNNWGTRIIGGTLSSADHTDIDGMADAGTMGTGNSGVYIFNGVTLIGTNLLEIDGTGGGGTRSNFGLFMSRNITADGAIVNGTATDTVSDDEAGDFFP
jgi:hypothetical protein